VLDFTKMSKLTVGDIADYEEWRRESRRKELITMTKELYGENIPPDALTQIQRELSKIPSIMTDDGFDITAARYLFWKSLSKTDKIITLNDVGEHLETDKLDQYTALLFPADIQLKKKRVRQPLKKKKTQ
jgi:hypothetical protein